MNIPDNTLDPHLLETIAHNRENCFRRCKILLAGFKATGEQDVDFMDTLMDDLLDFMDPQSDTERLYRDYIALWGRSMRNGETRCCNNSRTTSATGRPL